MAKLIDITGKAIAGEWGTDDDNGTGIPVLRTTNFTNEGIVDFSNVVTRTITKRNIAEKYLRHGDIIIEKSGGSDKQPVGRVIFFEGPEQKYLFNNFTGLLRVRDSSKWLPRYIFYTLFARYRSGGTRAFENRTTGLHNLQTDAYVNSVDVADKALNQQHLICDVLDRINQIIAERRQQLSALDNLIKARFVELFGDMLVNPLNWKQTRLDGVSNIVSGITKGRKPKSEELFEVPYMAVSNVKDGYIDWTTVKTIPATRTEIEQYRLLPFDVLMTEGGDPDKLGRGAIIHEPPANCIHQNHIFRVRLNQECLLPVFFAQYLQQQRAKRYFLGCAKQTTGIASINMKQLSALPVLSPPIELQRQYAAFVAQIDKSKFSIMASFPLLKRLPVYQRQEWTI